METKYLKINPADNVAVAITALPAGEKLTVDGKEITLNEDVPAGHKFALKDFAEGENVIKYGYPIGHARKAQKQGDWMNENNIKTNLSGLLEYTYNPVNVDLNTTTLNLNTGAPNLTFRGYKRKNGCLFTGRHYELPNSTICMTCPFYCEDKGGSGRGRDG